jgi:hypothetical protein
MEVAMDKRWLGYLAGERHHKLKRIYALSSGAARLHMTHDGVQRDITDETIARLRADVAEIEQILKEEGCTWDA